MMKAVLLIALNILSCQSTTGPHQHSVTLNWVASVTPPPLVGYYVYREKVGDAAFSRLNSSPVTATSFVDGTVQKKTTYVYYVTAVNSVGQESAFSNTFTAKIPNP